MIFDFDDQKSVSLIDGLPIACQGIDILQRAMVRLPFVCFVDASRSLSQTWTLNRVSMYIMPGFVFPPSLSYDSSIVEINVCLDFFPSYASTAVALY